MMTKKHLNSNGSKSRSRLKVPSVNFHLWQPCNMRCKFCFATFQDVKQSILPRGHLKREDALDVVQKLADFGFEKITFAGGEPTLCPWLTELIALAKSNGMTTMIVTNGSGLTSEFLANNKEQLDWVALSIDSLNAETNKKLGRNQLAKDPNGSFEYRAIIERIKTHNMRLKINTVVNALNFNEDFTQFIGEHKPERWKVLQVLPVKGQNDKNVNELLVSSEEFQRFKRNNSKVPVQTIYESNDVITGSYAMIDPAGRFFDNTHGEHNYSESIIKVGVRQAFSQVKIDGDKFEKRGGYYDWNTNRFNKITLSGKVASGKSTVGKALAKKLGYEFKSIGNQTRLKANELGISIVEFQEMCLKDRCLDQKIDSEFSDYCNNNKNLVIDYRLGFHFVKNAFNVFLCIGESEAVRRLKKGVRLNETHHTVRKRNDAFKRQFINAYGIDYTNVNAYDLVLNVESFKTLESIVEYISVKFKEFNHEV